MATGGSPRSSSASADPPDASPSIAKRIFRLMKKHGLLLQPYTGRRRAREHDGKIITIRSNIRWCADALEFTCWNDEIVRMAFVLDCHDREVMERVILIILILILTNFL